MVVHFDSFAIVKDGQRERRQHVLKNQDTSPYHTELVSGLLKQSAPLANVSVRKGSSEK
jgi:hypothetical protein